MTARAEQFLRRSQLVTPASNRRMIEKGAAADCDTLILDLEDGVAPSAKEEARRNVREAVAALAFPGKELGVRVNALDSPWFLDDLLCLEGLAIDTVILPKVHAPEDTLAVDRLLRQFRARGAARDPTLQLLIESARGLEQAAAIARASPRCVSLIFGAGDFAADAGVAFTPRGLQYARARIAAAAAAADVAAIDYVHPAFADDDGLRGQVVEARELGFSGKWAIHPRQVPIINAGFSPSADEIAEARRVLDAYARALADGTGAIAIDGIMVDEATLKIMQRRAAIAQRLGLGGA